MKSLLFILMVVGNHIEKERFPLVLLPQADKCPTCVESFISPIFRFSVVAGKWPENPSLLHCRSSKGIEDPHHLFCEDGLELALEGIAFK